MGIMDRLTRLVRANLNHQLSRAENPELLLNQIVRDVQANISTIRAQTVAMIAQEKMLASELAQLRRQARDWATRAESAVSAGRDDLARLALRRKRDLAEQIRVDEQQLQLQEKAVERLRIQLRRAESSALSLVARRDALIARNRRANAQQTIAHSLGQSALAMEMKRIERSIRRAEATASAAGELSADLPAPQSGAFADLELAAALQELKARVAITGGDNGPVLDDILDEEDYFALDDSPRPNALPSGR